jgi:hypothetical protein
MCGRLLKLRHFHALGSNHVKLGIEGVLHIKYSRMMHEAHRLARTGSSGDKKIRILARSSAHRLSTRAFASAIAAWFGQQLLEIVAR